jgi:ATP-dependent DNA ligase
VVFGYYKGAELIYAARTRNGFTPKFRAELLRKFKPLETSECPSRTCPRRKPDVGEWGCRWRRWKPKLVAQFEFVEWTEDAICAPYCTSSLTDAQRGAVLRSPPNIKSF